MNSQDYWKKLKEEIAKTGDREEHINLLRRFQRTHQKEIEERDRKGDLSLVALWSELTTLAEAVLQGSLLISWQGFGSNSGQNSQPQGDFAIVGMGKLGGRELTYRSDLDIIYLYEDPRDQEFFTRLGTRIISALTVLTPEGIAYQIDASLRPSGNAGTLVSSVRSFQEYHHKLGRTWERQALIKARPLMGRPDQSGHFLAQISQLFESITYQKYDAKKIAGEINHLRGRMEREIASERDGHYHLKTGRGGLVDIEFSVQYLQLIHGAKNPKIRNSNTILALRALKQENLITPPLADSLEKAYLFYRGLETRLRLLLDNPTDELIEGSDSLRRVEEHLGDDQEILPRYLSVREEVRKIYERILKV